MLIPSEIAQEFLDKYKLLMRLINKGEEPNDKEEYATLRALLYEKIDEMESLFSDAVGLDFVQSLRQVVFGRFVYLKKYKNGYALYSSKPAKYYLCKALTSPLDELLNPYTMIKTAIIPFQGYLLCDGLILTYNVYFSKRIEKDFRDGYWAAIKDATILQGK